MHDPLMGPYPYPWRERHVEIVVERPTAPRDTPLWLSLLRAIPEAAEPGDHDDDQSGVVIDMHGVALANLDAPAATPRSEAAPTAGAQAGGLDGDAQ